jgi:hypothetical protein
LILAGAVAALPAAELGHRGWLALRGRPHDPGFVRAELVRAESASAASPQATGDADPSRNEGFGRFTELQRRFLHPYLGWEQRGSLLQLAEFARRTPKRPRDYDVWILGGSVAEMFCGMGTGPFMRALLDDPRLAGRDVRVHALARGGWKMPQPLLAAQWMMMLGYTPDAIVVIDGFNEVAIALDNAVLDTHPLYPSVPHWGTLAAGGSLDVESMRRLTRAADAREEAATIAAHALAWGFERSSLASGFTLRRVRAALAVSAAAQAEETAHLSQIVEESVLAGPSFERGDDAILALAVRGWAECARQVQDLCDARGIAHLHVLQPTLHDPGAKRATRAELEAGAISDTWLRGVVGGYPRLREAGATLAREGVAFADASRLFADLEQPLYTDACHFDREGNRMLGAWMAARLLEHLKR